jgi:hypothetical protein
MSYTRFKTASFGPGKAGLATVGYTLTGGSRITAGVAEIGTSTGAYGASVTFADGFAGSILWDTGDSGVAYAADEVNAGALSTPGNLLATDSSGRVLLQPTQTGVTIPTVTTLTNLPAITTDWLTGTGTAASAVTKIQAGLATPTNITAGTITTTTNLTNAPTSGDFTATMKTSIGTAVAASAVSSVTGNVGGNVTGSVGSVVGAVGSVTGSVGSVTGLTTAAIATAVWTDTTAGDFTTATSPGKIIFTQLGGAFSTTSSSVFSTASLANAPTGGSAPTAAAIATAVWQDTTAGDFTVASSIGKSLYTSGSVPGASGGLFIAGTNATTTVSITGSLSGSVGSVTGLTTSAITTALWAQAMSDLASVPAATDSVLAGLTFVFEASRNKYTQTATTGTIYKDNSSTTLGTTTVADDGTTFSRGKLS